MNNFRLTHPKEGIADVNILFKSKSNSCLDFEWTWKDYTILVQTQKNNSTRSIYISYFPCLHYLWKHLFWDWNFSDIFSIQKTNTVCNSSCTPTRNYKHIPTERYNYLRTVSLVPTSSLLMSLQCLHLTHAPEKLQDS